MNIINLVCGAMANTGVPCDEYHLECVPDTVLASWIACFPIVGRRGLACMCLPALWTNTLKQETGFSLSLYWRGLNHLINTTVGCGLTFAEEFEVSC